MSTLETRFPPTHPSQCVLFLFQDQFQKVCIPKMCGLDPSTGQLHGQLMIPEKFPLMPGSSVSRSLLMGSALVFRYAFQTQPGIWKFYLLPHFPPEQSLQSARVRARGMVRSSQVSHGSGHIHNSMHARSLLDSQVEQSFINTPQCIFPSSFPC